MALFYILIASVLFQLISGQRVRARRVEREREGSWDLICLPFHNMNRKQNNALAREGKVVQIYIMKVHRKLIQIHVHPISSAK
jgi:hypothetical protein